ncbi:hypothetical protein HN371_04255 [Candidatus Poribacteria bacterium]|jgi:hypothetical protein|nr:hypothetical protein [Candidatus Poribacteria bacterium]MBT5713449.1 hypothetical protein [Candidatus Poribacteria bacterium]MBT7098835.1 hypothetical protein [Candidatus Poribacteria bacterium]
MLAGWLIAPAILLAIGTGDATGVGATRVVEGPVVLHGSISDQWGGHTFGYLVQGETGVFWSARLHDSDGATPTPIVGQHPASGSSLRRHVTTISRDEPRLKGWNPPQMVRSPDGHLHVFVGVDRRTDNPNVGSGRVRYFRSERPEDISSLVDRSDLLPPTPPFEDYHLRMNAGISRDGSRVALVILAVSPTGAFSFNTPVLLVGEREGRDFVFRPPVQYAEPMGLFYPQVAATDSGIVVVGQVWDEKVEKTSSARLLHIDWDGTLVHREDFPADGPGQHFVYDMRPATADTWDRLILYATAAPDAHVTATHEFWQYDVPSRQLRLLRSLEVPYGMSNAGKWLPASDNYSVFVNNPSMGRILIWEGDILGGGEVLRREMPTVDVLRLGYEATSYLFAPNPLQGSVYSPEAIAFAADSFNANRQDGASGPNSLLMWRLRLEAPVAATR